MNKRLRMFAGPNGSGKSTLLDSIKKKVDLGIYVNADEIEKKLREKQFITLKEFGINTLSSKEFYTSIKTHSLFKKAQETGYPIDLEIYTDKIVNPNKETHSYEAALIADLIRYKLVNLNKKFTFETVMSHQSKISFLETCHQKGYRNYLYFISTEDPIINIKRVEQRVKSGGHPVRKDKIESRYYKSLGFLKQVVKHTYRTFIFDSSKDTKLILEIYQGRDIKFHHNEIPNWVDKYLL